MRTLLLTLCTAAAAFAYADAPKQMAKPEPYMKDMPLVYLQGYKKKFPAGNNYIVKKAHVRGLCFELEDGSLWRVHPLGPQSRSFFEQKKRSVPYVEDLVKHWKQGDAVTFFQRREDVKQLMVYNATRDELIDVTPFAAPEVPGLTVASLDPNTGDIYLSDGSKWECKKYAPEYEWEVGDPIVIAKRSPWVIPGAPYVLINMCACRCDSTVRHIHPNRQAVYPARN